MSEDERELTKSEEWFRDRLIDYLSYGAAAFTIIAGWLLSNDSIISLAHEADADKREAAIVLAVIMPLAWLLWYFVILRLHAKCPPHPTVMSRGYLHLYSIAVAAALFVVWWLVAENA